MSVPGKMHSFFVPGISLIGVGACHGIPHYVHTYHITKPLIVTDKGIVNTGILKIITDILDGDNIPYSIYDKTVPNPTDENVTEGVAQYKADGCDGLISIGGGSSHDCCKGIGILLSNGGAIYQYEGVDKVNHMLPHYIAINTTAGTASELTRFCVITDKERHVKMSIVDWFLTPNVAVNDPVLMVGMPPSLTAATGMDALTHAIEAYVSTANSDYSDPLAIFAIKMIQKDLVDSYNGDMAKRDSMHNAQCLAGMAFSNALLGIVHSMAHKTGAAFADYGAHIIHGAANAMYLPKVIAFNAKDPTAKKRYGVIADYMNLGGKNDDEKVALLIAYLRKMNDQLNIPHGIKNYGADSYPCEQGFVPENVFLERLPEIAKNAIADACTGSNPRQPSQEEMEKLLKCCYYDTDVDF